MAILPNHLYYSILQLIVNQIYVYTFIPFDVVNEELFDNQQVSNNEVINLSLVSSKFFEICSNLLSVAINIDNYYFMKPLIYDIVDRSMGNRTSSSEGQFKLLSIKRNQLIKVYKSFTLYHQESSIIASESYYQQFRKVYITLLDESEFKLLSIPLNQFPINFEFNIDLELNSNDHQFIDLNQLGRNLTNINTIRVSGYIPHYYQEESDQLFQKLLQLNPKKLINSTTGSMDVQHGLLMKSINNLESLNINFGPVDPFDFAILNNNQDTSKLREISIKVDMQRLIGISQVDQEELNSADENDLENPYSFYVKLKKGWEVMIEKLKSNNTIKNLDIGFSNVFSHYKEKEVMPFANDLASVISSPTCSVQVLYLSSYGLIIKNSNFVNALSNNKSIKTIILLGNSDPTELFNKVLSANKSIRNIVFGDYALLSANIKCIKECQNINLYSITMVLLTSSLLSEVLDMLKSLLNPPNQFIIYIFNMKSKSFKFSIIKNQTTIINNSIVNIINIKYIK